MSNFRNGKYYFYDKLYCETPSLLFLTYFGIINLKVGCVTNRTELQTVLLLHTTNVRNGAGFRSTFYVLNYSNNI